MYVCVVVGRYNLSGVPCGRCHIQALFIPAPTDEDVDNNNNNNNISVRKQASGNTTNSVPDKDPPSPRAHSISSDSNSSARSTTSNDNGSPGSSTAQVGCVLSLGLVGSKRATYHCSSSPLALTHPLFVGVVVVLFVLWFLLLLDLGPSGRNSFASDRHPSKTTHTAK